MTADDLEKNSETEGDIGRADFFPHSETARDPGGAPGFVRETVSRRMERARSPRFTERVVQVDARASSRSRRGTASGRKFTELPVERSDTSPCADSPDISRVDAPDESAPSVFEDRNTADASVYVSETVPESDPPARTFASRPGRLRFGGDKTSDTPKPSPGEAKAKIDAPSEPGFGKGKKSLDPNIAPAAGKPTRARLKAEQASGKLDKAKEKLPSKRRKRPRLVFDGKKNRPKRELYFEKEVKPMREHLKGPVVTRPVRAAGNAAAAYGHGKLYLVEHENVAVKAAHRSEALAEGGLRALHRSRKTAPYRKVERLTRRTTRLGIKADFRDALRDNPNLRSNILSRAAQKRRIKKRYAKAARDAVKNAGRVKRTGDIAGRAASIAVRAAMRHPVVFIAVGGILLLFCLISALFASCSDMSAGAGSAITASIYLAEDADADGAELLYTELETDLRLQIMNIESDISGFDEYRYNIGDISHNPYELLAYLTARFRDFTLSGIDAELRDLFAEQYTLAFAESALTRYRTVTRTDPGTGESFEDTEAYDWRVLTVTLTARSFTDIVTERITDAEQLRHYDILMQTGGGLRYAGNPLGFGWIGNISDYYGWRVHPVTGAKNYHKGVDIAVPVGTDIYAAHDGTIDAGYDAGGYGNYVTLTGPGGLVTKYAHLADVLVADGRTVKAGELIARSGNSGRSTGPHLHFEVLRNGLYLSPIFFSDTGDN
jgi:murein DD-endopeptidase MepM/ murein hydrolase activator NlpD